MKKRPQHCLTKMLEAKKTKFSLPKVHLIIKKPIVFIEKKDPG